MKMYSKFHGLYSMLYQYAKTKSSSDLSGDEQYLIFFFSFSFSPVFALEFKSRLLGRAKRRQELYT